MPRIAGDRAADVHVLVEPGRTLVADPVAFERVAANLILNALRYGAPPVEVRAESDQYRLVVEDRGAGRRAGVRAAPVRALQPQRREPPLRRARLRASGSRSRRPTRSALGGELAYEPARAARRALHAVATGSSKLKREPSPSRDSTQIVPFIRRTSSREM